MATSDQMAGYAAHLNANTPASSKGKPVTEIAIFNLQSPYDLDHEAAASEFESQIVEHCQPGAPYAKGIRKIAWGFSVDDPKAFVWLLDWHRIEDHWDFWLTPGFPPVIETITKLFTPGRPLVRHFDFGRAGMLDKKVSVARIAVWDDGTQGKASGRAVSLLQTNSGAIDGRGGYAVDLDEGTWWSTLLGFDTESDATRAEVKSGQDAVDNTFLLKYALLD